MNFAPWDIYAKQLFPHKLGYPLWVPDPAPNASEVEIGDVGWLREGEFHKLFNTIEETEAAQIRRAVPVDFVPFSKEQALISGPREKIFQRVLCSRSIQRLDIEAKAEAGASIGPSELASARTNFSFKCAEDSGAILMLDPSGTVHEILSQMSISRYIRAHFERWMEFANSRFGLGLKDEELLFVSGTIKTSRWAVAAFYGDFCQKQGAVTGNLGSFSAIEFSLAISDVRLDSPYFRVGPPGKIRSTIGPAITGGSPRLDDVRTPAENAEAIDKQDQCIFLHYYKMKRRRRWLGKVPMQAAAGPHMLPSDPDNDNNPSPKSSSTECSNSSSDRLDVVPLYEIAYDPVNELLDYILMHSDARMAIASDLELFNMFEGSQLCQDIASVLAHNKPEIFVDGDGVGTLRSHSSGFWHEPSLNNSTVGGDIDVTPNCDISKKPEGATAVAKDVTRELANLAEASASSSASDTTFRRLLAGRDPLILPVPSVDARIVDIVNSRSTSERTLVEHRKRNSAGMKLDHPKGTPHITSPEDVLVTRAADPKPVQDTSMNKKSKLSISRRCFGLLRRKIFGSKFRKIDESNLPDVHAVGSTSDSN